MRIKCEIIDKILVLCLIDYLLHKSNILLLWKIIYLFISVVDRPSLYFPKELYLEGETVNK